MVADVVVLGGYGGFGQRIVRALASRDDGDKPSPPIAIAVAGRRLRQAAEFCAASGLPQLTPVEVDADRSDHLERVFRLSPKVLIDTAGPFQGTRRALARACIARGVHYIDLADDPRAVLDIVKLDAAAKAQDVLVLGGASTVPALSDAVVASLATGLARVDSIEIGIAPGYDGPRGLATIRSILSYVGRPIEQWRNGSVSAALGWSGTVRHRYPQPVGARWLSRVDVPDAVLLPRLYPHLRSLEIRAGLEVPLVHHGLGAVAWMVGRGWLRQPALHAALARRMASWFDAWGSDVGAMHVTVAGEQAGGLRLSRTWTVIAEAGAGPEIPGTAAVLLARALLAPRGSVGEIVVRGAMPATGLLTLESFERAWRRFPIRSSVVDEPGTVAG